MSDNKVENILQSAMDKLSEVSDANMIFGNPFITQSGATIIPVSKVTLAFMSGGGEYGKARILKPKAHPYSAGTGCVVSVKPCGFLIDKDDRIKYIRCPQDVYDKAISSCEEIIKNINEKTFKI